MKKLLLLLLLASGSWLTPAKGQTPAPFRHELAFGLSAGWGSSKVSFMPKVQTQTFPGMHFGLLLRWVTDHDRASQLSAGVQVELNYSQQGWSERYDDQPQAYYRRRLNFAELPFFTHIAWGGKRFRIFLNLGPQIGWFLSESTEENVVEAADASSQREEWGMSVDKHFAWGLCGGPGVEFRTPIGYFQIEGRYYYALGDIFNDRKADYFSMSSSQIMQARIAWLLPLRR
ncbi:MAG: PorT family protein [Tannerella sp.]|jgi:hypothetical protein|nr:PorT family protein [Tannerella sp.]